MIKEKEITIKGHSRNIQHYKKCGYSLIKVRKTINVKIEHLTPGSPTKIHAICDNPKCNIEKEIEYRQYYTQTKNFTTNYYCNDCKWIKTKNTIKQKYGVDNVMKVDSIKKILKESLKSKYGVDHYSKTDEYKIKYKETCLEKYGVDNSSKSEIVKQIISEKKLKHHNSIEKYKKLIDNKNYTINNYSYDIDNKNLIFKIFHNDCNKHFSINRMNLYDRINNKNIICTNCNSIEEFTSGREIELANWVKSLNFDIIENDREILNGKELDIYIPQHNLALEFNGLYWHSELYKHKNYHLDKSLKCQEKNIQLIHIYEDDWIFKQDIVKSIIKNRLGKTSYRIYGRKCIIKEVDSKTTRKFLDENHIQGFSKSKYKIGLYFENELVSLMTFGYRYSNIEKNKTLELLRFCNKINTNVIGASSKLFKYFLSNYEQYNKIISYSDYGIFDGGMYEKLNFNKIHLSKPNFFWVKGLDRQHRFVFNKKKLVNDGYDPNKTEIEIMNSRGYTRIWGCGQYKWEYTRLL